MSPQAAPARTAGNLQGSVTVTPNAMSLQTSPSAKTQGNPHGSVRIRPNAMSLQTATAGYPQGSLSSYAKVITPSSSTKVASSSAQDIAIATSRPARVITSAVQDSALITSYGSVSDTLLSTEENLVSPSVVTVSTSEELEAKGLLRRIQQSQPVEDVVQAQEALSEPYAGCMAVFQGQAEAPIYQSHHFESTNWNAVENRDDDIIIVTAYESGSPWMQHIVSKILFQSQQLPASVSEMSRWVDARAESVDELGQALAGQSWRRFLNTHLPADAFFPYFNQNAKYIYVACDGRDAFMSLTSNYERGTDEWYNVLNNTPGLVGDPLPHFSQVGTIEALFDRWLTEGWPSLPTETDGWPFWSYFNNVKTWWALESNFGLSNVLFVHKFNLREDLSGEMRRIAQFLEVPVNEDSWQDLVDSCACDEGLDGSWVGVLRADQVDAYETKAHAEFGDELAAYMATGSTGRRRDSYLSTGSSPSRG